MKTDHMVHRSTVRVLLAAAVILLVPWVAMQFTDQVAWDLFDFAVMGGLLVGTGLTYELAVRGADQIAQRVALGTALTGVFLLIWGSLAVGLIGSEDHPANLLYVGVLAVAFVGAIVARFQPHGMTRAMFATALAQALVAVVALIFGLGSPASGPVEILIGNGFFVALWIGSALLFRQAAPEQIPAGAESRL